jgi:lysophospholipase L1-like esterase
VRCLPDGRIKVGLSGTPGEPGVRIDLPVRATSAAGLVEVGLSAERDFVPVRLGLGSRGKASGTVRIDLMKKKQVHRISLRHFPGLAANRPLSLFLEPGWQAGPRGIDLVIDSLRLDPARRPAGRFIPASDRRIRYYGRLDDSGPRVRRIDWPVTVKLAFTGPKIGVRMLDGLNDWYYRIDNSRVRMLRTGYGDFHVLATGLRGRRHLLEMYKGTEAGIGLARLEGFVLAENGMILPPPRDPDLKILFLGDSITSGGANVNPHLKDAPSRWKQNGWLAYPAVTARLLGAQFHVISRGGIGLWRNWNGSKKTEKSTARLPDYFDRSVFHQGKGTGELWDDDPRKWKKSKRLWDHRRWIPDVVVVFLGTNDCCTVDVGGGKRPVDGKAFTAAYRRFLDRIRSAFGPRTLIFCLSPLENVKERNQARTDIEALVRRRNDPNIVHCDAMTGRGYGMAPAPAPWMSGRSKDYVGDRTHPHVKGHAKLARALAYQIRMKMRNR